MKKALLFIFLAGFFLLAGGLFTVRSEPTPTPTPTQAPSSCVSTVQECKDKNLSCSDCEDYLKNQISNLQGQGRTLSSQISVMDNQVRLTQLRIDKARQDLEELEKDIGLLKGKISNLEVDLDSLTKVLLTRIVATYQAGAVKPWQFFVTARGFPDFIYRLQYLKIAQENDKRLIFATQATKDNFENQRKILEVKQKQVEALNRQLEGLVVQLAQQKKDKERLLEITRNDEKRYQELLARARAEFEAIQNIIAGKGQETEVGSVSEGQKIASVISGASCNSNGTHVHFIVSKNGSTENPFNHLKGGIDYENCSGSSCGSSDGDPFNPLGNWNWPLEPKIKLTQGYGSTWATRNDPIIRQIYSFHNGIDIVGLSSEVKTVRAGTLYRGSYVGYNGCSLRYVRVDHNESDLDTFYLHINYIL